jgi:hypothetical protein
MATNQEMLQEMKKDMNVKDKAVPVTGREVPIGI